MIVIISTDCVVNFIILVHCVIIIGTNCLTRSIRILDHIDPFLHLLLLIARVFQQIGPQVRAPVHILSFRSTETKVYLWHTVALR